jgi:hypothetical protein
MSFEKTLFLWRAEFMLLIDFFLVPHFFETLVDVGAMGSMAMTVFIVVIDSVTPS